MLMSDCMTVRPVEVYDNIMMLDINKTCVHNITAGHLNYDSHRLCLLNAMCFTGFLVYGVLPDLYKRNLGTDMCICALKELVAKYVGQNSSVFVFYRCIQSLG